MSPANQPSFYASDFEQSDTYPARFVWLMFTVGTFVGFSVAAVVYGLV